MLKTRVIPVLFLMNGSIVRSEEFKKFQIIGDPLNQLDRLSQWRADELVYIDISREDHIDMRRRDSKVVPKSDIVAILQDIAKVSFMPLTFGGRINNIKTVDQFIKNGADKVLINSEAHRNPALITEVADKYGRQAMMVGIDVKREDDEHHVFIEQGTRKLSEDVVTVAKRAENAGAGEILLNSIDRDGMAAGYDTEIIRMVADNVGIPVIACGGVGAFPHFCAGIDDGHASAVAAGNIFHFTEQSYKRAKRTLRDRDYNVRYHWPT
jgi:imidazole glycerol-phosphate synthase subunit HisF